jgi:hypothetical protein
LATLDFVDDEEDEEDYAEGEAGNEKLISELDEAADIIAKRNKVILDANLEDDVKFDPNADIEGVTSEKIEEEPTQTKVEDDNPDNY